MLSPNCRLPSRIKSNSGPLLILAILSLACLLRLPLLTGSFWLDEAAQALESVRPLSQQFALDYDFQPPLYHLLLHPLTLISRSEWWLRLASLVPGLFTIYFTYLLGTGLIDRRTGLVSALIVATSQFHIFYSQELRPYSLAAMFGVLSTYLLVRWLHSHHHRYLIQYFLTSLAGLYSVYTYPFLILGHMVFVFSRHRQFRLHFTITIASLIVGFLPWLPSMLTQMGNALNLAQTTPGWGSVVSLPMLKALPLTLIKLTLGRFDINYSAATVILTAVGLALWATSIWRSRSTRSFSPLIIISASTLLAAYVVHSAAPIIEPKRFLLLLPLFAVMAASNLTTHARKFLLPGLLAVNSLALFLYWTQPDFQREPWRQAVAQIESIAPDHAVIAFRFHAPFAPWRWYQSRDLATVSFPRLRLDSLTDLDTTYQPALASDHIYLFSYLQDITDPHNLVQDWLSTNGYVSGGFLQYPGLGKIDFYHHGRIFAHTP